MVEESLSSSPLIIPKLMKDKLDFLKTIKLILHVGQMSEKQLLVLRAQTDV